MKALTDTELIAVSGGDGITETSHAAYDVFNIFGMVAGAIYGILARPVTTNWHSGTLGYSAAEY